MNWLDIVLAIILLACTVRGLRRGFTRQIVSIVSGIVALILGVWFYGIPAAWIAPYVSSPMLASAAGFAAVFLTVLLVGGFVSAVVQRFLKFTGLSIFDHALGGGLGFLRGLLVSTAIVMGAMAFTRADQPPRAIVESRLAPYVVYSAQVVAAMAPHDLKEGFRKTYGQVKAAWNHALEKGIHDTPGEKKKDARQI
jgi:membrane protein required for colicin V production